MEYLPLIVTIAITLVLLFVPKVKYVAKSLGTIVHELGHAIVVIPFGGKLKGIKLQANTEGEAVVAIPQYGFPAYQLLRIVNLFAGYSAPIYLGLVLLVSYIFEYTTWLPILFGIMSVVVLLFIRNLFGVVIALSFLALNALFILVIPQYIALYGLGLSLLLLVRGSIDIYNIARWTFADALPSSDFVFAAEELGGTTRIWFIVFCVFHVVVLSALGLVFFSIT